MSRSQITCPTCKQPLAVKHHGGRLVVLLESLKAQALVADGAELVCRCGGKRFVRLAAPDAEQAA